MSVIDRQKVELLLEEAVKKHKAGDLEDAIALYLQTIESSEKQFDWVYANAITLLAQLGREDKGLSLGRQSLDVHPESDEIYRAIGLALNKKGDFKGAVRNYLRCLSLNQNQPDWLFSSLINHLTEAGEVRQAIEVGRLGETLHGKSVWIFYHLGEAYAVSGEWLTALSYYTKAAKMQSDLPNITGKINLAIANLVENESSSTLRLEEKIATYQRTIELSPHQEPWFYLRWVDCLFAADLLDEAVKAIQKATQTYPDRVELFHEHYFKVIVARDNEDPQLILDLLTALKDNQEFERAAAICQTGLELYPDNREIAAWKKELGQMLAKQSKSTSGGAGAISSENLPDNSLPGWQTYLDRGNELQAAGNLDEAVQNYQQSIIRNPNCSWSYHNLADTLLKQEKLEDAILFYRRALELYPYYFWSYYNLGVAYNNSGRWHDAIALYRRSIKYNPNSYLPYQALRSSLTHQWNDMYAKGDHLLKQGKYDEARTVFSRGIKRFKELSYVPRLVNPREIPAHPKVILIVDNHLSQCLHYRVEQKVEQLEHAGMEVEYFPWGDVKQAKNRLSFYHVVIFYRVPALPELIETIEYAKAIKKVVFYEIDDLIFNAEKYPDPIESYGGQVSEEQYRGLLRGTTLFRKAMALCDYGIASTPALAEEMKSVVKQKVFVHRNALDRLNSQFARLNLPKVQRDCLSIFYGSGTKAHNADFEQLLAPAIGKILQRHPNVRLTLMGYLTLPEALIPFKKQIERVDLVKDITVYWTFLRQADINIAVLLPTTVNNCKSELKWFEAAAMGVPSVVSNTQTYAEIVNDGVDALIASTPEEWYAKLDLLICDREFRTQIAQTAAQRVWQEYSVPTMANNIKNIVLSGIKAEIQAGNLQPRTAKKKLLIVNVFYPPQSIGGATRIVRDNIKVLQERYGAEYEISVFTTDNDNPHPYEIQEYSFEGVHVTKVSSPMMVGMDWQHQNPKMYDIFSEYLDFNQPELIHFHCVQRLTGSVVEAAGERQIPYLVTVHDAWWISDHQFLINDRGEECNYQQNDPLVAARDTNDLGTSITRKLYLQQLLSKANGVLAVSEAFTKLYRLNGINNTQANRNGIIPQPRLPREPSITGKVRFAHVGGMATHKGYFLFQEAVEKAQLNNCEVIVVSHAQVSGSISHGSWGDTPVTFVSKIPQTKMYEFYSRIDVLMAPSMWPESFGLVTREAAAAGVWVVASNKGALAEDLVEGVNGDVFDPSEVDNLVTILQRIDRQPEKYLQLIEQDIEIRTTEQQVRELIPIYQSVIEENARSRQPEI